LSPEAGQDTHNSLPSISPNSSSSPENQVKGSAWQFRDLWFAGVVLFFPYILLILKPFQYEPWIALPFYSALAFLGQLSFLITALWIIKKRNAWPVVFMPRPVHLGREGLKAFALVLAMNLAVGLFVFFLGMALNMQREAPDLMRLMQGGPNSLPIIGIMLMGFLLAPVAEELFFRGFLYNALKQWLPVPAAIGIQSVLFAVIHNYDLLNTVAILLVGLTLTIIYQRQGNLLRPMLMHAFLNGMVIIPFLFLSMQNYHVPAATWEESRIDPAWMTPDSPDIPPQKNADDQWQYAVDTWGSKGSRQWKKEASAFRSVCLHFPEDRTACAKAKLGVITIYANHLFDYRRAVTEAQFLLKEYPEQRLQVASALAKMGWSHYMLQDFAQSRAAFLLVTQQHADSKNAAVSAQKGLLWLEKINR